MQPKITINKKTEKNERNPYLKFHKEDLKEGFYYLTLGAGILVVLGGVG
jgi:hypothetical protein